jgi:ABC-type glutathione transport system ATPase component
MSIFTVKDLSKTYKVRRRRGRTAVKAVDGVTFSLKPGDKIGIIGASGCGKTTLLNLILGLTAPTSGAIEMNALAGFVAQDPYSSLCHAMTIGKIIAEPLIFAGKYRNAAQCEEEIKRVMALVNLSYNEYAARYPHQLSGGERQRVSIARAMINRPGFLVLDEPTSMIDYEVKSNISAVIKNITESAGTAILLVTHDIAVAYELCDTLFVMNSGKIIETGPAEDVILNPRHEYTRKLILAGGDIEAYWDTRPLIRNALCG